MHQNNLCCTFFYLLENREKRCMKSYDLQLGIVLCHDGKVFCYCSSEKITKLMYDLYFADSYKKLHDEYLAQYEALKKLSETYDIEFWEVI